LRQSKQRRRRLGYDKILPGKCEVGFFVEG
jgi:hypothetical protein